jgi:tetratricopeptide (TPR) repeat protein
MIPYYYFEYLRTRQAMRLVPIFHHNALDILSLACLTAIVPFAFRRPEEAELRHGSDVLGLARWLARAERHEEALRLYRRAIDLGLPDDLLFRTLWDVAATEKKLGRDDAALAVYSELAGSRNGYRVKALEELAKHYEHRERNYSMALEMTRTALSVEESPCLRRREQRLERRACRLPRRLL